MKRANKIAKKYWSKRMLSVNQKESHLDNKADLIINDYTVDDLGFLINPDEWTEAFAANALGLLPRSLSTQHKDVLHYVRNKYLHLGALPSVRHVCKSVGIEKSELKVLFGSCLQLWRAAGLPLPDDEIRSHMN
jgi:sulfur relay (sulfurtransferase) DsrC/TusE family protein